MSLEIIPGDRIGNIKINMNPDEVRIFLPSYIVTDCGHEYLVICDELELWLRIHKWHNKITSIGTDSPQYSYEDKARVGMLFGEFEENFPDWDLFYAYSLPNAPGIEFYFSDEDPQIVDEEEKRLSIKLESIAVFDPDIDWEVELKKPHLPCPFSDEEIVERWNDPKKQ
jgi:hypothetical protein